MCLLMLSRIGLALWHLDRVNDSSGWLSILFNGLRIDLATLSSLLVVPAFLSCFFAGNTTSGKAWLFFVRIWIVLGLWLLVYMELATPPFIMEYDVRPNRLFVEYLKYPAEVFGMLWSGYKLELLIGLLGSIASIYFGWRFSKHAVSGLTFPKWYWRPVWALMILIIAVMGARSTFEHRPLNPAMVAFSTDPLMNDLVLNSTYSLMFAIKQMQDEANAAKYYGEMPEQEIISQLRQSTSIKPELFISETTPTLSKHIASYQGKPKNLVILLQESLGARYVGGLGGLPLTPNIDNLISENWNFTRMYATGTRSVRGIEAVITGFSPTPGRAVVKLGKSQSDFFTIAELLKRKGYATQFIYGGESHFDNMKSFFLGNGFTNIQDFPTFEKPEFVGSWGASDGDLYNKAHQQFQQFSKQDKPFFSLVFSSSNHSPFEFPDGKIELYNQPKQTRENAAKYSDYAIGEFFKLAKASDYWDNTIFIVVADHDSRATGNQLVPIDHYRIPAVIIGKDIPVKSDSRLASQIDIPPTLLSLMGINSLNPMIGNDLTQKIEPVKLRAMMQYFKNFAWMNNEDDVVVFQPGKQPQGFHYSQDAKKLTKQDVTNDLIKTAKANALWGSHAYNKGLYSSKEIN